MNISGIRPLEGFYTYNVNRINEQRSIQIQNAKEQEPQVEAQQQNTAVQEARPEQNFTAFDYAQNYQPDATYEMKGSESDLYLLDVEKAISDMQKDQLLQQYQFFVGNSQQAEVGTAALSPVRSTENFEL